MSTLSELMSALTRVGAQAMAMILEAMGYMRITHAIGLRYFQKYLLDEKGSRTGDDSYGVRSPTIEAYTLA